MKMERFVRIIKRGEEPPEYTHWVGKTIEERIHAVEDIKILSWKLQGNGINRRLERVYKLVKREKG